MTGEQAALLSQMLTLAGVLIGIAWSMAQHHWSEKARIRLEERIEADRKEDAERLESDRALLALNLDHKRQAEMADQEARLERRAEEIRQRMDRQAADLADRQQSIAHGIIAIADEVQGNTEITQQGLDAARAAYTIANDLNAKIAAANEAAKRAAERNSDVISTIQTTGDDTNERVRTVEDVGVPPDDGGKHP